MIILLTIDSESVIFECFLYIISFNLSVTLLKTVVEIDHIRGQEGEVNRCLEVEEKEKSKRNVGKQDTWKKN